MQIKPIGSQFPQAIDEAREEERRKRKQDERQKPDRPAATEAAAATPSPAAAPPSTTDIPSQAADSESLVKLLEKCSTPPSAAATAFLANGKNPSKNKTETAPDVKKVDKAL